MYWMVLAVKAVYSSAVDFGASFLYLQSKAWASRSPVTVAKRAPRELVRRAASEDCQR